MFKKKQCLIKMFGAYIKAFAVYGLWAGLELIMYGEVQSRSVDNVIGTILVGSLYGNLVHWQDRRV